MESLECIICISAFFVCSTENPTGWHGFVLFTTTRRICIWLTGSPPPHILEGCLFFSYQNVCWFSYVWVSEPFGFFVRKIQLSFIASFHYSLGRIRLGWVPVQYKMSDHLQWNLIRGTIVTPWRPRRLNDFISLYFNLVKYTQCNRRPKLTENSIPKFITMQYLRDAKHVPKSQRQYTRNFKLVCIQNW